ncbi:hypothetical protein DI09_248p10, partial [Mitosporidium daphniae]
LFELPIELEYWRDSNVLQCHSSFPLTGPDPFNVDDEFQSKICSYQSTAGTANAAGTTNTGFTTATNRQINISTRSLKKARLLFQDHTDESLAPPSNAEQAIDGSEKIASFFTTASNKAIPISLNSLLKVNEFLLHPESPNWTEPPSSTAPTKFEEPQKVPKKDQMTMPCNENPAKPSDQLKAYLDRSRSDQARFLYDLDVNNVPCRSTNFSQCFLKLPKYPRDCVTMLPDQVFNTFAVVQALKCNATINGGLLDQNWVTLQLRIEFERACALFRFLRVNYEHQNLNHLHAFFHRIFSLDYFVCRMTYRYFKDISGKNRSCLRRIYECDDSSCKPMVLYVSDIFYKCTNSDEALWLEFCDGWYFGEFKVDHHISSLYVGPSDGIDPKPLFCNITHESVAFKKFPLRKGSESSTAYFKLGYNAVAIAPWDCKLGFSNISIFSLNREISSFDINGGLVPVINNLVLPVKIQPFLFIRKSISSPKTPVPNNSSFLITFEQENDLLARLMAILDSSSISSDEANSIMEMYVSSSSPFCLLISYSAAVGNAPKWIIIRLWKTNPDDLNYLLPINSVFSIFQKSRLPEAHFNLFKDEFLEYISNAVYITLFPCVFVKHLASNLTPNATLTDELKNQSVVLTSLHELKEFYLYLDSNSLSVYLLLVMIKKPILQSVFIDGFEIFHSKPIEANIKTNVDAPLSLSNLIFINHDPKYNLYIFESTSLVCSMMTKDAVSTAVLERLRYFLILLNLGHPIGKLVF